MTTTSDDVNPRLPTWNGDWTVFKNFETRVGLEIDGTKSDEKALLGPRIAKNLTGKAWEMIEDIDRAKLKEENGATFLLNHLKQQRGRDKVDLLGDAMRDLLQKPEVLRMDGEELMEYLPRFKTYVKALRMALHEIDENKNMPSEFYGWYLLNVGVRLEPSDVANIKAKAENYSMEAIENALKLMWSGGGLAQKDVERKRMKNLNKTYLAASEENASGVYEVEEEEAEPQDDEDEQEQFEDLAAALLETPEDEQLMTAYQDAKKKMQYKDARKMLAKSRVTREFYPMKGGGKGGNDKGHSKPPEFNGDCMRCGKYGHKARHCPQKFEKKNNISGGKGHVNYVNEPNLETNLMIMTGDQHEATYVTGHVDTGFKAILDSGASESIIGVDTLQEFYEALEGLGFDARSEIQIDRNLRRNFIFGNSAVGEAIGLATITVGLFGVEQQIEVHVIDGSAPLLLSSKFMYQSNITVDFRQGKAWFQGDYKTCVDLERAPSFHLMISVLEFPGKWINRNSTSEDRAMGDGEVDHDSLEPSERARTERQLGI